MDVILPLHEQREYPSKKIVPFNLEKGTILETLTWDKKTEDVDIKERLILRNFRWLEKGRYEFLTLFFERVDLKKQDEEIEKIVNKILDKHFETMKYTFIGQMVASAERMIDKGYLVMTDIKKMEKHETKIKKGIEKRAESEGREER